jgi:hypothetical protein
MMPSRKSKSTTKEEGATQLEAQQAKGDDDDVGNDVDNEEKPVGNAVELADNVSTAINKLAGATKEVEELAGAVTNQVGEVLEESTEKAQKLAGAAANQVKEASQGATTEAQAALIDATKEEADKVKKLAEEEADKVKKLAEEEADKVKKLAEEEADKVKKLAEEKVGKVAEALEEEIDKYKPPGTDLALAAMDKALTAGPEMIAKATAIAKTIITMIPPAIMYFAALSSAAIYIVGLCIIIYIVYYIMTQGYPRPWKLYNYLNFETVDQHINQTTAAALADYVGGVKLINYATAKGPYNKALYTVSGVELQACLDDVAGYINMYRGAGSPYNALSDYVTKKNIKLTNTKAVKELFYKALNAGDETLVNLLKNNSGRFRADLDMLSERGLFNFIDYAAYERGSPHLDDTLVKFGPYAEIAGMPIGKVLGNIKNARVKRHLASTQGELEQNNLGLDKKIKGFVNRLREITEIMVRAVGGTMEDYTAHVGARGGRAYVEGMGDQSDHPRLGVYNALMQHDVMVMDLRKHLSTVDRASMDSIESTTYQQFEKLLLTKYNKGDGNFVVLSDADRKKYVAIYNDMMAMQRYKLYKPSIDRALFLVLYWHNGHKQDFVTNLTKLSSMDLSLNQLYLFREYYNLSFDYREWRHINGANVWDIFFRKLLLPSSEQYIYKNVIKDTFYALFDFPSMYRKGRDMWEWVYKFASNPDLYVGDRFVDGDPRVAAGSPPWGKIDLYGEREEKGDEKGEGKGKGKGRDADQKETFVAGKKKESGGVGVGVGDGGDGGSDAEKERVEEGFLGAILKPIIDPLKGIFGPLGIIGDVFFGIANLMASIGDLVTGLVKIILALVSSITNPIKFIKILFGLVAYLLVMILLVILSIPIAIVPTGVHLCVVLLILMNVPICLLKVFMNLGMYALIVGMGFILTVIDSTNTDGLLLRGFYHYFMSCENDPTSWYTRGGYHHGNKHEQIIGGCSSPCAPSYRPAYGGLFCQRDPGFIPPYCTQAAIMSISAGAPTGKPLSLTRGLPKDYGSMTKPEKQRIVEAMTAQKAEYYETCGRSMAPFDPVVKNICRHADFVGGGSTQADLKALCNVTFCKNGRNEPFCYRYYKAPPVSSRSNALVGSQNVLVQIVIIILMLIVFTALLHYFVTSRILLHGSSDIKFYGPKTPQ